jgi:hypothetical protein
LWACRPDPGCLIRPGCVMRRCLIRPGCVMRRCLIRPGCVMRRCLIRPGCVMRCCLIRPGCVMRRCCLIRPGTRSRRRCHVGRLLHLLRLVLGLVLQGGLGRARGWGLLRGLRSSGSRVLRWGLGCLGKGLGKGAG